MSSTRPPFLVDYESDVNNWTTGEQSGGKPLMDKEQENKQASVLLVAFETNKLHPNSCITVLYAVSLSLPLINLRCWSEISLKSGNPNISCFISARTREREMPEFPELPFRLPSTLPSFWEYYSYLFVWDHLLLLSLSPRFEVTFKASMVSFCALDMILIVRQCANQDQLRIETTTTATSSRPECEINIKTLR